VQRDADHDDDLAASNPAFVDESLMRLKHFMAPTLSHLLALIRLPPASLLGNGTSMIVIDTISASIDQALPRGMDDMASASKSDASRWLAGRRQAIIADIATRLSRLAAMHDLVVLVTSNTVTRITADTGAVLRPALGGQAWDSAVANRVALFRDWLPSASQSSPSPRYPHAARFAQVVRSDGREVSAVFAQLKVVAFQIEQVSTTPSVRIVPTMTSLD